MPASFGRHCARSKPRAIARADALRRSCTLGAVRRSVPWLVLVVAFGLRSAAGVARHDRGPEGFPLGYEGFLDAARSLLDGHGGCLGETCAHYVPLYPALLVLPLALDAPWLAALLQALVGTLTCWCAYAIGARVFDARTGVLACALCAVYPYYVVHDTALQETSLHALCVALSVWLLLRAGASERPRHFALAGLVLGAATLVRAASLPLALAAAAWSAAWGVRGPARGRASAAAALLLGCALVVAPWVARNRALTGAVVLSSQTGLHLFRGNNPQTFASYPARSMDDSSSYAFAALTQDDRARLRSCGETEVAISACLRAQALRYVRQEPGSALAGAVRKVAAGFSPRLNPERSSLAQFVYALGYVPVLVLGLIGLLLEWRRREVKLFALFVFTFGALTAVFYAHSSHRSHLDLYFMVLAASVLTRHVFRGDVPPS